MGIRRNLRVAKKKKVKIPTVTITAPKNASVIGTGPMEKSTCAGSEISVILFLIIL